MRPPITVMLLLVAALLASACASATPPSQQDVIASLTDDLIVPRFQTVAGEMSDMRDALEALCANSNANTLNAARNAWREARAPWLRSQSMWFGPVMDRRSRTFVDWSPIDPERIETTLARRESVSANEVREFLGSTQRGLGAIEYVIFGDDAKIMAALDDPTGIRCQYVIALGEVVADETVGVLADWTGDGSVSGGYAGYFRGAAGVALVDQQAIDEVVRTSVFITRSINDMRLGKALGADGGQSDPSAIPGGAGNNAVADLRNQVQGMQDTYLGAGTDESLGISALVQGVSKDADERMRGHFAAALEAIDGLQEPLHMTVVSNPESARLAHRRMQELQRALNTEVVSLLGVTVGFADTDGDGG